MKYHALFVIFEKEKQQNLKLSSTAKIGSALCANCHKTYFDQILLKVT